MNYQVNEVYTLKVLGLVLDTRTEQHYLQLQDEEGKTYRVKPFNYYIDWAGSLDTVDCVVGGIDELTHRPWFKLRKLDLLEKLYEVGESYPFVVREKCVDNNGAQYYVIEDNVREISQRYYSRSNHEVGDIFSLTVKDIEENNYKDAYLTFEPENAPAVAPVIKKKDDAEIVEGLAEQREKVGGAEGLCVEWKSSIAFVAGEIEANIDRQLSIILKIIASFQNAKGGNLYIGVNDNGAISGINQDFQYLNTGTDVTEHGMKYSASLDSYQLKIHNAVKARLGAMSNSNIDIKFAKEGDLYYCIVSVQPMRRPVFLDQTVLFQRAGNMCQRLRGEEITNFILDREHQFAQYHSSVQVQPEIKYVEKEQEAQPIQEPVAIKTNSSDVKFYMQFYDNGQWSYSKKQSSASDLKIEVPIYKETLKEVLLLCYDNGCVNRIRPYDFLNPKRTNGRRGWKDEDRRYENGFSLAANLLNVYSCVAGDYIAVYSTDKNGDKYAKVHALSAVAEHTSIQLKGNQVVPTDSTEVSYTLIKAHQYHFVSALCLRDYQTTTNSGFRRKNIQLRATFDNLDKLAKQS